MKRCVIPISGGLDSTIILHHAKKNLKFDEIYCVSFNYGQRHLRELECAEYQCKETSVEAHKVLDISFVKDIVTTSSLTNMNIDVAKTKDVLGDPQTVNYVPFRNMMMLSICCAYAESVEADTVFHGAALVDSQAGYWDGSNEFLDSINNVVSLNRRDRITVEAPLIKLSKKEIIELGIQLQVDFKNTHTCYSGNKIADASNPASSSRIKGFIDAGFIDPVKYKQKIPWKDYNCTKLSY
jgi:7-cyano-7-deazaguanine synthase